MSYINIGEWQPYPSKRPKGFVAISKRGNLIRMPWRTAQANAGAFEPANKTDTRSAVEALASDSPVVIILSNELGERASSGPTRPVGQT